jgi:hypothetical protein
MYNQILYKHDVVISLCNITLTHDASMSYYSSKYKKCAMSNWNVSISLGSQIK